VSLHSVFLAAKAWAYNALGWLLSRTDAGGTNFIYTYDPNGQVTNR
jgi:YD repeat-containing protein